MTTSTLACTCTRTYRRGRGGTQGIALSLRPAHGTIVSAHWVHRFLEGLLPTALIEGYHFFREDEVSPPNGTCAEVWEVIHLYIDHFLSRQ